jgi:hypothetical protein|tara:strand:+ start:206 stop:340 length:135 start_codon:yes stop_codon:yes gene_type:complete
MPRPVKRTTEERNMRKVGIEDNLEYFTTTNVKKENYKEMHRIEP